MSGSKKKKKAKGVSDTPLNGSSIMGQYQHNPHIQVFEHFIIGKDGPERRKSFTKPPISECITSPFELRIEKETYGLLDLPGRTMALLTFLLLFSVILSVFGLFFFFYPLITEELNLQVFQIPKFPNSEYAREILRGAIVFAHWTLPIQWMNLYLGPAGVLLAAFVGITLSSREMGMVTNVQYRFRTENPFNYARTVFFFVLCSHAVTMSAQWTIQRFSPPFCCNTLGFLTRVIPHILALLLTLPIQFKPNDIILEIMTPIAVLSSTLGLTIAIVFCLLTYQLTESLPSDGVFQNYQFPATKPLHYWRKFLKYPSIWVHIYIHTMFFSFKIYWISSIPTAHGSLGWSQSIPSCYKGFLLCDGVGRYALPFLIDGLFSERFTRLDALSLMSVPLLCFNIFGVLSYRNHYLTLFWFYYATGSLALMHTYAISITRATVDCFFVTSLLSTSQTLAIVVVLALNHGTYRLSFIAVIRILHLILSIGMIAHLSLWVKHCDFLGDKWGYPHGQVLKGFHPHTSLSQLFIPTAMIPLWVHRRSEQEKIQLNYYKWNHRRIFPSEILKKNVARESVEFLFQNQQQELMREVKERIVL